MTALRDRVKSAHAQARRDRMIQAAFVDALSNTEQRLRDDLLQEFKRLRTHYERLGERYHGTPGFMTVPEVQARALYEFGQRAGILTAADRPRWVRDGVQV